MTEPLQSEESCEVWGGGKAQGITEIPSLGRDLLWGEHLELEPSLLQCCALGPSTSWQQKGDQARFTHSTFLC